MLNYIIIFLLVIGSAYAYEVYTPTSKTVCENGRCSSELYSGVMFDQKDGNWVDAGQILYITKHEDDITFHYDGNEYYNVTFETGVIYYGAYYPFSIIKSIFPSIQFDFPVEEHTSFKKYSVNITNIPVSIQPGIEYITLTYKDHYGFTLEQLQASNLKYNIKDKFQLGFDDVLERHTLSINKLERRIYIGDINNDILDNSLYIDPTLSLSSATTDNLGDTYTRLSAPNTNSGNAQNFYINGVASPTSAYIKWNISRIVGSDGIVNKGELRLYINDFISMDNITLFQVYNFTWDEDELTYANSPCLKSGGCNNTIIDTKNTSTTGIFLNFTVTEPLTASVLNQNTTVSFKLNGTGVAEDVEIGTRENTVAAKRPVLYVEFDINRTVETFSYDVFDDTRWVQKCNGACADTTITNDSMFIEGDGDFSPVNSDAFAPNQTMVLTNASDIVIKFDVRHARSEGGTNTWKVWMVRNTSVAYSANNDKYDWAFYLTNTSGKMDLVGDERLVSARACADTNITYNNSVTEAWYTVTLRRQNADVDYRINTTNQDSGWLDCADFSRDPADAQHEYAFISVLNGEYQFDNLEYCQWGDWNETQRTCFPYVDAPPAPEDTCTYTSGDWNIDCSDSCVITDNYDLGGNDITITGTGITTISSDITGYSTFTIQGTDSSNKCYVEIY